MWRSHLSVISILLACVVLINTQNPFTLTQVGTKYYLLDDTNTTTWHGALKFCAIRGLRLLSINNAEENFLLGRYLNGRPYKFTSFWAGGCDQAKEGDWVWFHTAQPFTFENWSGQEPDNLSTDKCSKQDCLQLNLVGNEILWSDEYCTQTRQFICETYHK